MLLHKAEDAGEAAPEIEVEDDSEAPELFNDIKEQNEQLFPVAWAMYKK